MLCIEKLLSRCRHLLAVALLLATGGALADAPPALPRPRLVVMLAVDQFSAGLLEQSRGRFKAGLHTLLEHGLVFPNGYQSHGVTETCPGHSTMLTGQHPSATGIIANEWLTADGTREYCVADTAAEVPGRPRAPRGAAHLRASTLGEWLRAADPDSRTVAVSAKDRAAITLAGHEPFAVYFWDDEQGFNYSQRPGAARAPVAAASQAFNAALERRWAAGPPRWTAESPACSSLHAEVDYGSFKVGAGLPPDVKPVPGWRQGREFAAWLRSSPVIDELTADFALELVRRFQLGQRQSTDLLAVSFSATDYIGHRFGNQGIEMCEQLGRLDRTLGRVLAALDALKVPYVLALTADHGAADAAERLAQRAIPARRLQPDIAGIAQRVSQAREPAARWRFEANGLYLALDRPPAARAALLAEVATALKAEPGIVEALPKAALLALKVRAVPPDALTLAERLAESIDAERSPDLLVTFEAFATLGAASPGYVASHGSPWDYDRRVPILFYWPQARGYEQYMPVDTVDIAPTLAALAGLAAPAVAGRCLELVPGLCRRQ